MLHGIAKREEIAAFELARALGMKPQAVSNQLQRLQTAGIVASRRDGNNVRYRIIDRCVLVLMDRGLCFLEEDQKRHSDRANTRAVPYTEESLK